jgi:bifunctional DNase/RNase
VDARPSDCLALAAANKRPVYVAASLFDEVEDMSEVLQRLNDQREKSDDDSDDEPE